MKFFLGMFFGFTAGLVFSELMVSWVGAGPGPIRLTVMAVYIAIYGWPH